MAKKATQSPLASTSGGTTKASLGTSEIPMDTLFVKIRSLRLSDDEPQEYALRVVYYDQLILSTVIQSIGSKDVEQSLFIADGKMSYDPSDYENMCQFANSPLVVSIHPVQGSISSESTVKTSKASAESPKNEKSMSETAKNEKSMSVTAKNEKSMSETAKNEKSMSSYTMSNFAKSQSQAVDVSCCNVDILPMILGYEGINKFYVKKRMEPMIKPTVLQSKSWDCLPLLTMEISVERDEQNSEHHNVLKEANWMKLTLVAAYNLILPFEPTHTYTAASKTPLHCEVEDYSHTGIVRFIGGSKIPHHFNPTNFYPNWESINVGNQAFKKADELFVCNLNNLQNEDDIDLHYYIREMPQDHTVVWGSFHRSLLIEKSSEDWLSSQIQEYKWPFEVNINVEDGSYSFMAFLNLFQLLYPGVNSLCLAVPLQWLNSTRMLMECNCNPLLTSFYKHAMSSTPPRGDRSVGNRTQTESTATTETDLSEVNTGADYSNAFIIVEVKLARPLKKAAIPTFILKDEMLNMLKTMESNEFKRRCVGRTIVTNKWQSTVQNVATALRKTPYYGVIEPSVFIRQLSETKTRVEISTAFWQDSALYANNKFVVQQYLHSDDICEELVMMTHACLMRLAINALADHDPLQKKVDPVHRAARQARQVRDINHAMELYLQVLVKTPCDSNIWRELATCLKDINREWARVVLNNSIMLNPRHPLTLVSVCGMLFEDDKDAAEQFIVTLLALYPFWILGLTLASAFYYERQQFIVSEKIMTIIQKTEREGEAEQMPYVCSWERELGDWWESTHLQPGMSHFYGAADLLLRLRCVAFAEVCLARALLDAGESCTYYHLIALCCRLRGQYDDALCHLQIGITLYGDVSYLRSLEADCHHMLGNITDSMASYEKCRSSTYPFTVLMMLPIYSQLTQKVAVLTDLVRQFPCAYSWLALADNWLASPEKKEKDDAENSPTNCAAACAVQAIKWDRMAGSAWALLSTIVKPSARRLYCLKMAALCGYDVNKDRKESDSASQQSSCYRLGTAITECRCRNCKRLRF